MNDIAVMKSKEEEGDSVVVLRKGGEAAMPLSLTYGASEKYRTDGLWMPRRRKHRTVEVLEMGSEKLSGR
ncbi:uncharacterized protein N7515_003542 [Penicillium bovifimosum]|uniref:Uncharacterized protein n=1 Tax=Penicillium bovifimosum TaxID=126998 RepID=A0A9W9H667_9EURO|nr:uncharacterized protein N7515_003542 [Penicillium bovifimosum]KAJ5138694.1 hypothetical protein N7515_003542 [Penicillium bovifimosum]